MIRSASLAFLSLLVLPGHAAAADPLPAPAPPVESSGLLWPTDAGRCVTSSFCEFRPNHFHSGIDISTGGTTGFRCFAVSDGEISRARVSCEGYGRAIYLALEDGRTVVYAHLSRFAGELGDRIREAQEARGSAYLDLEFPDGSLPVSRGDVIGWTGQSGAGVPHLHVEIRDRLERPLDPLREAWPVADTTAPVVTRVAVTPLSPPSAVDGASGTVVFDVLPRTVSGAGHLARAVPVEGEVGISVEIDETTDACRFRLAPRRIELREGGLLLYAVEYGNFAFSQTGLLDLQIDPQFSYSKEGRFHHLWRRAANTLPFVEEPRERSGVLSAGAIPEEERVPDADSAWLYPQHASVQTAGQARRSLEIVVFDAAGNRGSATVDLSFAAPPQVTSLSARLDRSTRPDPDSDVSLEEAWDDTVLVEGRVRAPARAIRRVVLELSTDLGETWDLAPPTPVGERYAFEARIPVARRIPGQGRGAVLVRAQAVDTQGAMGLAKTVAVDGAPVPPARSPDARVITRGAWLEVRFPESAVWSALSGGTHDGHAVLVRSDGAGARIVLRPREWSSPVVEWSGNGREWKGFDPWGRAVPIRFRVPGVIRDGETLRGERGLAEFRFPVGCVPEEAFAVVRESAAPTSHAELRPVAPFHRLDDGNVPMTGSYSVTLRPAPGLECDRDHLGIFMEDGDRLRYIDTRREENGWVARSRTLLGIGLFEDETPPVLGDPRLEKLSGRARLSFLAEDAGAGIDCDDVEVFFEGAPVLCEFDDETGDVIAFPVLPAGAPGGECEIRVADRCGNGTRWVGRVSLP